MYDFKIDKTGDLEISENGDISLTESICQIVDIRLKWIKNEWRLGPDFGLPYFEDILVKAPNIEFIGGLITAELLDIEGVTDAKIRKSEFDRKERKATFYISFTVEEELFEREVTLNV